MVKQLRSHFFLAKENLSEAAANMKACIDEMVDYELDSDNPSLEELLSLADWKPEYDDAGNISGVLYTGQEEFVEYAVEILAAAIRDQMYIDFLMKDEVVRYKFDCGIFETYPPLYADTYLKEQKPEVARVREDLLRMNVNSLWSIRNSYQKWSGNNYRVLRPISEFDEMVRDMPPREVIRRFGIHYDTIGDAIYFEQKMRYPHLMTFHNEESASETMLLDMNEIARYVVENNIELMSITHG